MKLITKKSGFSLTEVLLAVGVLAIGMTFISGTFLAGIYLSTVSTERTIAAVVADEAFAKIRIFGLDPDDQNLSVDRLIQYEALNTAIPPDEFAYPSTKTSSDKQYYWSALCRSVDSNPANRLIQVTVFVSRKIGQGTVYPGGLDRPVPIEVEVSFVSGSSRDNTLTISNPGEQTYINDGYKIVNRTGEIYRVVQRDPDSPNTIILDRPWQGGLTNSVWVVPPPLGGGRYPGIAIYQKVIRF
jgi:prepilin-type N-terminal cleavage/methylation domain-containing protein